MILRMVRNFLWSVVIFALVYLLAGCSNQQEPNSETDGAIAASVPPTAYPVDGAEPSPVLDADKPVPTTESPPTEPDNTSRANADVLYVVAKQESDSSWHFTVTVEHPDTGWEDYADGWDVVLPDGSVARPDPDSPFTRLLLHPHETEQPFTRSQGGVVIGPEITNVTVRAHDLVDGFGGREVTLDLSRDSGPDYEVQKLQE